MSLEPQIALERVIELGDDRQVWRALRVSGAPAGEAPALSSQSEDGSFVGETGRASPGFTGYELCHLCGTGLAGGAEARRAADWLLQARTPAQAWLDAPDDVPGIIESQGAGRVWATASASCALLAAGRDPGERALGLLRSESDLEGRFTGGAYPTFAAAGAYWLAEGPKTEMAEWALRWAREWAEDWWGPWEWVSGLTFWAAAGIPPENRTVEGFLDSLRGAAPPEGFDDVELTLRAAELMARFGA